MAWDKKKNFTENSILQYSLCRKKRLILSIAKYLLFEHLKKKYPPPQARQIKPLRCKSLVSATDYEKEKH